VISFRAASGTSCPPATTGRDCKIGGALALEYLAMEEADTHGPGHLPKIVGDSSRAPLTGVEVGFLTMVAYAARAGADRAREIAAYWESCWQAEKKAAPTRRAKGQPASSASRGRPHPPRSTTAAGQP